MNVAAILDNAPILQATDGGELRSTLLWIVDEMDWLGTIAGSMSGLSWPLDAPDRIERLRTVANAWDPFTPPPVNVLDSARKCLGILQPTQTTP